MEKRIYLKTVFGWLGKGTRNKLKCFCVCWGFVELLSSVASGACPRYAYMYVCTVITYRAEYGSTGIVVANPARSQLNRRELKFSMSPFAP